MATVALGRINKVYPNGFHAVARVDPKAPVTPEYKRQPAEPPQIPPGRAAAVACLTRRSRHWLTGMRQPVRGMTVTECTGNLQ